MELADSLDHGPHALLASLVGTYEGRARVWFEPEVLADDEPVTALVASVAGGRFVRHTYDTRVQGEDHQGAAIFGCTLPAMRWTVAWLDSFHTGTELFVSDGLWLPDDPVDVSTTYAAPEGPPWGWRTMIAPTDGGMVVRHFNVPPDGTEALAVELDLVRT